MADLKKKKKKKKANPFIGFVAGGFGGVCNVLSGHPLDTIKVRLQTMPLSDPGRPPLYSGAFDCAYKIVKNEGVLGLYKGMSAPLTGVAPIFAMCFAGYNLGKYLQQGSNNTDLTNKQFFLAGAFAGLFSSIVTVPGERIKCLLQVQLERKYNGLFDTFNKLYAEGGLRSVYRGGCLTLLRDIPANGCYFLVYEIIQKQIKLRTHSNEVNMLGTIFSGGMAGISYWIVGMPVDVLKSRIQTASEEEYKQGVRGVLKTLLIKQGPSSLFRGIGPVFLRAFPANAACFFGIELATKYLNKALPKIPIKKDQEGLEGPVYDTHLATPTAMHKEEKKEDRAQI